MPPFARRDGRSSIYRAGRVKPHEKRTSAEYSGDGAKPNWLNDRDGGLYAMVAYKSLLISCAESIWITAHNEDLF